MKEIRDRLNELGAKTNKGGDIDLNFVSGILHNIRYMGEYKYRDIVIPDGIPAIVPKDSFDRVQELMEKNKKAPAQHKAEDDYLLTTKLFCGAFMVGEIGTSKYKNRKYRYYRYVNTKQRKTCNAKHKSIRKDKIEFVVIKHVKETIYLQG